MANTDGDHPHNLMENPVQRRDGPPQPRINLLVNRREYFRRSLPVVETKPQPSKDRIHNFSLMKSAITAVMANFSKYSKSETEFIKYLPNYIKLIFLKKFLYSKIYSPIIDTGYFLSLVINEGVRVINLSSYYVDDGIMELLQKCTDLEVLNIDQSTKEPVENPLQEATLRHTLPKFRKLSFITIQNCDAVTDDVLIDMVDSCRRLEKICLANCKYLTDVGIKEITKLDNLSALDLSGTQISDTGLGYMIDSSIVMRIQDIRLDHCCNIREFDFTSLVRRCAALEYFSCLGYRMQDTMNTWDADSMNNLKQINWTIHW